MRNRVLLILIFISIFISDILSQVPGSTQPVRSIALVIGNSDYKSNPLFAPVNDSKAMAGVLGKLGFEVYEHNNIDKKGFLAVIEKFGKDLIGSKAGLFYFAGHGIQSKGYNYLVPVDATLPDENSVKSECIQVDRILEIMAGAGTEVKIMILDAGFTNPFDWNFPDSLKGFVSINAPLGSIISSAASPGRPARDNKKRDHGLLTSAILETIEIPDITIEMMFQKARKIVAKESENLQIPWESTSLTEDFYFNPVAVADVSGNQVSLRQQATLVKPAGKYSIEIKSPPSDNFVTANDKLNIQTCIKTQEKIQKLMIYRNDSFVNGFLSNNLSSRGDCDVFIDEPVSLSLGINNIRIDVFAGEDTISKSLTVEYSLASARYFALLIGNEIYDDPQINDLDAPVKDATEMYNTLTSKYNFDPHNVMLLKSPTKAEIIGALHKLRTQITPADNLLIFYAGHGFWDEGMGMGFWFPKDASKNNPVNWIPNTDLTNFLGAIKSKHTLLIADACFSGGIFKTRAIAASSHAVEMLYQLNSRNAITSGTMTEVPDRSVFIQYLMKNLKENTSPYLPAQELFSKIKMAVINNSSNVPQFGIIQNVGDEGGDFIFIMK